MDASTALLHGTLFVHLLSWFNHRYTSGEDDSKDSSVANTWVEVLKMGGTKSAEELAKAAGVDVSTDAHQCNKNKITVLLKTVILLSSAVNHNGFTVRMN